MRSRDRIVGQTQRLVAPYSIAIPHQDHVVFDTPSWRDTWYGHRLELDHAPVSVEPWFDRWRQAHKGKNIGRAYLTWESDHPATLPALPEQHRVERHLGMVHPGASTGASPTRWVREASDTEWDAVTRGAVAQQDASMKGYTAGFYGRLRALPGRRTWAAFRDDEVVAAVSVVPGGPWARVQDVWTDPNHRRQGLCEALLRQALDQQGPTVIVPVLGGDAERIYRRVGFETRTWTWDVSIDPTAPS